jgi:hypothetical protein
MQQNFFEVLYFMDNFSILEFRTFGLLYGWLKETLSICVCLAKFGSKLSLHKLES